MVRIDAGYPIIFAMSLVLLQLILASFLQPG